MSAVLVSRDARFVTDEALRQSYEVALQRAIAQRLHAVDDLAVYVEAVAASPSLPEGLRRLAAVQQQCHSTRLAYIEEARAAGYDDDEIFSALRLNINDFSSRFPIGGST